MWSYENLISEERIAYFNKFKSYDEVLDLVASNIQIQFYLDEEGEKVHLKGCLRPSFLLKTTREIYDVFFNSSIGYRAQYADSISEGETANRAVLSKVKPLLIDYVRTLSSSKLSIEKISYSLSCRAAKIWIYEDEQGVQDHLGSFEPEIKHPNWNPGCNDKMGLLAPVGTNLEIKGGWLDNLGNEKIDPCKVNRSKQINECGFS